MCSHSPSTRSLAASAGGWDARSGRRRLDELVRRYLQHRLERRELRRQLGQMAADLEKLDAQVSALRSQLDIRGVPQDRASGADPLSGADLPDIKGSRQDSS